MREDERVVSLAAILRHTRPDCANTYARETKSMNMQARSSGAVHFWISDEFTGVCFPCIAHDCLDGTAATAIRARAGRTAVSRVRWSRAEMLPRTSTLKPGPAKDTHRSSDWMTNTMQRDTKFLEASLCLLALSLWQMYLLSVCNK